MKKSSVLIATVAALGAAFTGSSQAAGPYTIAGPALGSTDGASRFARASCNPSLDDSPADGIDSQIVDVNGRGGTVLSVQWSAQAEIARTLQGQLTARFFDGNCSSTGGNQLVTSRSPGGWAVPVPHGTKWMVVVSTFEVQVSFSFP